MTARRTVQIVWIAALAALAILTILLQLDYMARRSPALAPAVPQFLRSQAQVPITKSALQANDTARALAEARLLVQRRPLPAENLSLLAIAQAKADQAPAAARTIQLAGQRGWREPLAQEAVLRLALEVGNQPEAARRYAALFLRESTPEPLLEELGRSVLGGSGKVGRDTLTEIVVGGERWHTIFLRRGPKVMPPAAFAAIAAESLRRGSAFDCGALAQSIKLLTQRDAGADAGAALASAAAARCPKLNRAAS